MAHPPAQIDFCTLGMYIIDEIHPSPTSNKPPQLNIPGGAGLYSALGARLHSPPPHLSSSIGWIVDMGSDFPSSHLSLINSWDTSVVLRRRGKGELTTRGWNGYSENEVRGFRYLTEKKRLTSGDLAAEEGGLLLGSRSFHLICSPARCVEEVEAILRSRSSLFKRASLEHAGDDAAAAEEEDEDDDDERRPLLIWEPIPDLCLPSSLPSTLLAARQVDIISPNHDELASLFSTTHPSSGIDRNLVESQALHLLKSGIGPSGKGAIVVRCGAAGCYILSSSISRWLPAYHTSPSSVIDPTGGGNAFLGGLAVGMVRTNGDIVEACRWGSVSASFCIEQVGVAELSSGQDGEGERWNGVGVKERLEEFRGRTLMMGEKGG